MALFTFILISFGFIVIPGPNVLVVISTSISHGKKRGIQTVAGISLAMATQLGIAAIGTTWFVATLSQGFALLKWIGVGYLAYLGVNHIISVMSSRHTQKRISALGTFQRGFWVSLTNPKTILFFSAFLPQFALEPSFYVAQITILSVVFWLVAVLVNCGYVLLSCQLSQWLKNKEISKLQNGVSGVFYLVAGAGLALSKNS